MTPTIIGVITAASIFGGAVLGMALRRLVPEDHLSADSVDAVKLGAGMISLMAALVLGLLVSSAKSNFDAASAAITQVGAKVILLDRVLLHYGPEAAEVRQDLRRAVAAGIETLWPQERPTEFAMKAFERATAMERLLEEMRALEPHTEAQRSLHAQAQQLGNDLLETRWMQIEQAQTPLPTAFLVILLFWLTMLYASFGLVAPRNATVVTAMFVGALAVATAVFLIVEMSHPMDGVIRVSSAPLRKALEFLRP